MPLALLSVYNKKGITDFARQLDQLGWEIISFVIDCCGTWVVSFYFYVQSL